MRFARKLMLLAVAAVAAMAFAAAPASATDTVAVVDESTGQSCGTLGCSVHAVGLATLRVDLFFFEANEATCNLEVEMRVSGNGSGVVDATEHNTGPDSNCATVTTECNLPWSASGEEDGTAGVVQSNIGVCLNPAESDSDCVGNLAFNITEQAGEHYETNFNNATVGLCELDVDLEVEEGGESGIHVNHP